MQGLHCITMQATKNPSQIIGVRCRIGDGSWREQESAIENQRESEGELERAGIFLRLLHLGAKKAHSALLANNVLNISLFAD